MKTHGTHTRNLTRKIKELLSITPGMSVKELALALNVNRQFMAGFLAAMEENGEVFSRKVGPARIYYNNEVKIWPKERKS